MKKNSVGGIAVDEDELKAAFEFFDVSGKGKITLNDLKNRLGMYTTCTNHTLIITCLTQTQFTF